MDKKKILISWIVNLFVVYFVGMQLVLVFSGNIGITVNPKYLFITSSYFMGLTIFILIVPLFLLMNKMNDKDASDKDNYSSLTDMDYYKKKMTL